MKKPTKPRKPSKPKKPDAFYDEYESIKSFQGKPEYSLADFIGDVEKTLTKKKEDIDFTEVILDFDYIDVGKLIKFPNPDFHKEQKRYEKALKVYPDKVKIWKEKMRVYEIEHPIWKAWNYSQKQDSLKNDIEKLKRDIKDLEQKKEALLEEAGDETTKSNP